MSEPFTAAEADPTRAATALDALVAACTQAVERPHEALAAWKHAHPGAPAVGFFPTSVPTELIRACGALPFGLWGGPIAVSQANAHVQQFTCSIVRSATEYALGGACDALDAVLFPPICDSVKLVASIWQRNFASRFLVEMVTLPERLDSTASAGYLAAELRRVAQALAERLGAAGHEAALPGAIVEGNRVRAALAAFDALRARSPTRLPYAAAAAVVRASVLLDPARYLALLGAALHECETQPPAPAPRGAGRIPVVVTGLACQLPHPQFLALFDEAGLAVVADDLLLGLRGAAVAPGGDPYDALARAFVAGPPLATRHHGGSARHEFVLQQCSERRARGIVFLVPKFCEPEWFDLRYLRDAAAARGIAHLALDFDEDASGFGAALTRLEAFAETLA